jgi:choline/glycine/proline betaine transport protein
MERAEREGGRLRRRTVAATGGSVPEKTWRQRLANLRSYPSKKSAGQFLERTVEPALTDVRAEFARQGYVTTLVSSVDEETGLDRHTLTVSMDEYRAFEYTVAAVDVYYRLEVFTQTGSEGYDLMGLSKQQIIDDVLDRYEAHLGFLRYSSDHAQPSLLTPSEPISPELGEAAQ